jgi:hypothetical protein
VAKYGGFLYYPSGNALAKVYGGAALPSLSVEPFTALTVDYDQVELSWVNPVGDFRRFRLLRSQEGIPDTEEDGLILYDSATVPSFTTFTDNGTLQSGNVVPIIRGRHVYYSIWLWLGEDEFNRWYLVGNVYTTMPTSHPVITGTGTESTTHTRLMESLPKILTSSDLNALGTTDYESDLAKFLQGFSFTTDQLLTLTDLLLPNSSFINLTPELLNAYAGNLGVEPENRLSTKYQRKLVRNALLLYAEKGTSSSLNGFVESLTGYSTDIVLSPNLMLSAQDSTFYKGVGNWVAGANCAITSVVGTPPDVGEATTSELRYRVDSNYIGQVITSAADAVVTNGAANVRTKGIPVIGDTLYVFSFYQKTVATTPTLTLGVSWYDYTGNIIGTQVTGTGTGTAAWTKLSSAELLSPTNAVYAVVSIKFSAANTYFIDMIQFAESSVVETSEARGVGVVLSPTKQNLILNPSVEDNTTGWTGTNTTLTTALLGTPISGVPTGLDYLVSTASSAANVVIATTSPAATVNPGDYTFSAYLKSATSPTAGYNVTIEAYNSTPYSNYVAVPTPTGASTGWSYAAGTGGTFTTTYPSSGGPPDNATNVSLAFSATPTSGDVSVAVSSAGIAPTLVADTEYAFKIWVRTSRTATLFPVITWTGADEETGDDVVIAANTWTQVQFTTTAPSEATDVGVALVFAVSDNSFASGDTIKVAKAEFGPVTYISTTNWDPSDNVWERFAATVSVPSSAVIPDAMSFKTTISYVATAATVGLDGAQLEYGNHATDYFDGSSYNANWNGGDTAAGAAYSHMYGSRDSKIARLGQELVNYLPLGTPYYVETTEGVEFIGTFKGYA